MAGFKEFAHEIRKRDSDYPAATTNHIAMYAKDDNRVYIIDETGHLADFEAYNIYGYTLSTSADARIGGDISVTGDSFLNKNVYVTLDAFIGGIVSVTGDGFFNKNVSISGNATVYGYLSSPKGDNTSTGGNEGFGKYALSSASSATFNTAVGVSAASNVITGTQGVAVGYGAATNSKADIGAYVAIGYLAMSNYNGASATGYSGNVAIGTFAMQFAGGSYTFYTGTGPVTVNTQSGAFGTACGFNSGLWNSGINNTSYGQSSLKYNNTGANNVAVGRQCMEGLSATDLSGSTYPITNSSSNIGIGLAALRRTYSASGNVAIGNNSMNSVGYNPSANLFATFTGNTGVGNGTLQKINTGSNNVAIGSGSANNLDSGNYNVFIGVNSGISEISGSNKLYIHSSSASTSTSAGALIYGDFANGQLYNVGNRILTSSNYGSLVTNVSELTIAGKLTVGGLIDPTGLELTPVAANPGIIPNNTLWTNSADSNRLYYGNAPVGTGGGDGVPVGSMIDYGGGTVEDGYLLCNGAAVSRSLFAELFAKIGTIHGNGDGFSTFNVPNMCRRVAVGSGGSGTSVLGSTVGNVGGEETHTLTLAESPSHFHTLVNDGFGNVIAHYGGGGFAGLLSWSSDSNGDASHPPFTNSQGGNGAHNNMQPSLVVTKMIKCSTLSPSGSVNKTVTGTLTVNGNINAGSGIQFTTQSSNPGNVDTLWVDNTNSLYFGSTPVVVSGGVSNIETLTTSVTDTSKVLKPDGVGGVTWGSGPIITDWVDAGPVTITAPTSNPTKGTTSRDKVWWRRVGDSMEVRIEYSQTSAGTQGSGAYQFLIPNSKSIDLSKSNVSNDNTGNSALYAPFSCVGTCIVVAGTSPGTNIGTGVVSVYDATHVRITAQDDGAADTRFVGSPGVEWFSLQWDATRYGITFTVPIVGWTATTGAT